MFGSNVFRGLIDRILLSGAVIAGGLVPGFIAQYRQRLGGRFDQIRIDLAPWQKIADDLYQGNIAQLVQYHLGSSDSTIHAEGAAIGALVASERQLGIAVDALHGSLLQQIGYLALHLDTDIARATFGDWVPTFALSAEGLTFAVLFGVSVWLLFLLTWSLLARAFARGRLRAPASR